MSPVSPPFKKSPFSTPVRKFRCWSAKFLRGSGRNSVPLVSSDDENEQTARKSKWITPISSPLTTPDSGIASVTHAILGNDQPYTPLDTSTDSKFTSTTYLSFDKTNSTIIEDKVENELESSEGRKASHSKPCRSSTSSYVDFPKLESSYSRKDSSTQEFPECLSLSDLDAPYWRKIGYRTSVVSRNNEQRSSDYVDATEDFDLSPSITKVSRHDGYSQGILDKANSRWSKIDTLPDCKGRSSIYGNLWESTTPTCTSDNVFSFNSTSEEYTSNRSYLTRFASPQAFEVNI